MTDLQATRNKAAKNTHLSSFAKINGASIYGQASRRPCFVLGYFLIFYFFLLEQAIADPYEDSTFNFGHLLTMEEGFLGPGRVIAIAQDKRGYIWIT
jgi:hypothetical protein